MTSNTQDPGKLCLRAMDSAERFVSGVKPAQWTDPTPCDEWDLRDLVGHITYEALWAVELFAGKTMADVGDRFEGDNLGDDPASAFSAALADVRTSLNAPGAMERICHLSFGDFSGADYAGQLFIDFLVHGWDVAKGSAQDATLDPDLCAACIPLAKELVGMAKSSGADVFGTTVEGVDGLPAQDRLLAIVGRRGDWPT